MMNKNLATLLKEEKYEDINLILDPIHPEKYSIPNILWGLCLKGLDWLPPIKRK